jgi:hypothetical protein
MKQGTPQGSVRPNEGNSDALSLLTRVAGVLSIIGVYLYFAGWIRLYEYYREFGLSLDSLDVPVYSFLIYSYGVIQTPWGIVLLLGVAAMFALFASGRLHVNGLAAALVFYFPLMCWLAERTGHSDRTGTDRFAKVVCHSLKDATPFAKETEFLRHNENSCAMNMDGNGTKLHLLLNRNDQVIVFFRNGRSQASPDLVYSVPKSNLSFVRITAQN